MRLVRRRGRQKSLRSRGKNGAALTVAVAGFLAELRLSGPELVHASLALHLAEAFASRRLCRARIAAELRELIAVLSEADRLEPYGSRLLEGVLDG
jgi:hypothetical protein